MALSLLADRVFPSVQAISPRWLAQEGVTLLLADLDNTLSAYGVPEPDEPVRAWERALREAGVTLFILSNNRKPERARRYAQSLGVPYIGHAGKPKPGSFRRAMEQMGAGPGQTAIVGDQILYRYSGREAGRSAHPSGGAYPAGGQPGPLSALRGGVALPRPGQAKEHVA